MFSPSAEIFVSSANPEIRASLRQVLLNPLPPGGGLWVPSSTPVGLGLLASGVPDYPRLAEAVIGPFLAGSLGEDVLRRACKEAFDFPVPLVRPAGYAGRPEARLSVLELFRGPSGAFKDFAVRFLVRVLAAVLGEAQRLTVLTATSGDTGAAVAEACSNVPGLRAVILYPRGGVSPVQESQIARVRPGVIALAVEGTFDDCQTLVKSALSDPVLRERHGLVTANSINPVRLIAQVPFAFHARRLVPAGRSLGIVVPSGNLGNVAAVQLARRMGLGLASLTAATNLNSPLPELLAGVPYRPRRTVPTLSNAMDIGDPNNLPRLLAWNDPAFSVGAEPVNDEETLDTLRRVSREGCYLVCPHTAVGWRVAERLLTRPGAPDELVVFGTAHPGKFPEVIEAALGPGSAPAWEGGLPAPAALGMRAEHAELVAVLASGQGY